MPIIQKIWHTGHASIVFEIYCQENKKYYLIFNADSKNFIYTQKNKPVDKKTNNNFILLLKKYFLNSLVSIDFSNNYATIIGGEIKLILSNKINETAVFSKQKLLLLYKKNYQINEENILLKKQKKQQKLLANLNNDLLKWQNYIKKEYEADLIKSNLHLVKPGDTSLACIDYSIEPFKHVVINIDSNYPIKIYLEKLYKNIKKAKRAITIIQERIVLAKSNLINLNQNVVFNQPVKINTPKRLPYKEFLSSDNIKILVGKSAKDSEQMLKFNTNGNDFWFHIRDQAGPHVIVKYAKDDLPITTLLEASILALHFSKTKDNQGIVQYTKAKWIKKPKNSKPGQVVISHEKTMLIKIDEQILKNLLQQQTK